MTAKPLPLRLLPGSLGVFFGRHPRLGLPQPDRVAEDRVAPVHLVRLRGAAGQVEAADVPAAEEAEGMRAHSLLLPAPKT